MDIRNNGHFYRNSSKPSTEAQPALTELTSDLDAAISNTASSKVLVAAYKNLMQHFNQLNKPSQDKWSLEVNIIARQLAHLFKQTSRGGSYNSSYPALNLLKEMRQLDEKIMGTTKDNVESLI